LDTDPSPSAGDGDEPAPPTIPGPSGEYGNYTPNKEWGGTLPGIPGAVRVKSTGKRQTYKDEDGNCYEWDRQHGTVEKYDKRGNHLGEYDPVTGAQTDSPIPSRRPDSGCRK
jgi:filamentous hemagglutinin